MGHNDKPSYIIARGKLLIETKEKQRKFIDDCPKFHVEIEKALSDYPKAPFYVRWWNSFRWWLHDKICPDCEESQL